MAEREVIAPRALRKGALPDSFTRALYSCAPYRGCAHGCRYCDGRAEKYYVEGDFEKDIDIRTNLPDLLRTELPPLRDRGMISLGSGVTDAYQPAEAERRITEQCLQPLIDKGWPVLVITKSALIQRDLDRWRLVNEAGGFLLFMTVTGTDEDIRRVMEPRAAEYRERFETLALFRSAGIETGALAMPIQPGLGDDDESLTRLFGALKETGVSFIMPGGLTLRPGRQKDLYLRTISEFRPDLVKTYRRLYAEERPSGAPIAAATRAFAARCAAVLRGIGLPWTLPHKSYSRLLPVHDALRVLYRDMVELYAGRGIATGPLKSAADRYDAWLKTTRSEFRRRRTLPPCWLEDRIRNAVELGEMERVLDNPKLSTFTKEIVSGGHTFDYLDLKLSDG